MKSKARQRQQIKPPSRPSLSPRFRGMLIVLALLSITLLAFSNSFSAGFTLDNKGLLRDPRITEVSVRNAGLILNHSYWWPSGEAGLYRPFTTFTYLLNYAILGNRDQPAGYHWINLVLHLANVLLVYVLILRLSGQIWTAAFTATLWAVHPVLTESVTNIVGRADLLAALATLSGFWMYLKSAERAGTHRAFWLVGLAGVTAMGVFSKESAVCIVVVIVVYELVWWKGRPRLNALLLGCAATLVPIAAMLVQRSAVLAASLPAELPFTDNPIVDAGFWTGRLTAVGVITRYLWIVCWPAKLSSDYSFGEIPLAPGTFGDWLSLGAVLLLVLLVAVLYKRNRLAFFLASFSAITFLPMSNLLFPVGTIMAERFLYLPSIGLVGCAVIALYAASRRLGGKQAAPILLCLILAGLTMRTWARNNDWRDDLSITTASLEASPKSFKLHRELAELFYGADQSPENRERGEKESEQSVALLDPLPDSKKTGDAFCLRGGYELIRGGQLSQAQPDGSMVVSSAGRDAYRRAIEILQRCAAIDRSVRAAYLEKAVRSPRSWNRALMPARGDPQPYLMLSVAFLRLNELDQAGAAAEQALRLHPRSAAAYGQIASVFLMQGRKESVADALMEGFLLTSDPALGKAIVEQYENGLDSNRCILEESGGSPTINPRCEPLRQRVCAIAPKVIEARLQAGRPDLAEEQRHGFLSDYGCPAAALEWAPR